jgi:hypothetical protein
MQKRESVIATKFAGDLDDGENIKTETHLSCAKQQVEKEAAGLSIL